MRLSTSIDKFSNVTNAGKAIFYLPSNCTIHNARFTSAGSVAIADVTLVEVIRYGKSQGDGISKKGDDVMHSYTGRQIDEFNMIRNVQDYVTAGYTLKLLFEDQTLKTPAAQVATSLKIGPNESARIEITTQTTGPQWTLDVDMEDGVLPNGYDMRRRVYDTASLATGAPTTDVLPAGKNDPRYWNRLLARPSAGTLTRLRVLAGKQKSEAWNRLMVRNNRILADLGFTVGSYWTGIADFCETGIMESIDMMKYAMANENVNVELSNATGATYNLFLETLEARA